MSTSSIGRSQSLEISNVKVSEKNVEIKYDLEELKEAEIQSLIDRNPALQILNSKIINRAGGPKDKPILIKISHALPKPQKFNDNPLWAVPILAHRVTLGLIPWTVTKHLDLEVTVQDGNGKILSRKVYENTARIWWWSPLILTGRAKKISDKSLSDPLYAEAFERALLNVDQSSVLLTK